MNLNDIAVLCGVSASTVSRALNNDPRISRETTQKIHETVGRYHFIPSKRKRPSGRSHVILLLVIPDSSKIGHNPFFDMGELLNAINSAFQQEKTHIETKTFSQLERLETDNDLNYSGVVFAFGKVSERIKGSFKERRIPYIFLNRTFEEENYVSCNNVKGVIRLVNHLHRRGAGSIGYLGCSSIAVNRDRFRGYSIACQELWGGMDQKLIYHVDSIEEVDETCAAYFRDQGCDAVFGFNDNFAIRLISAFQSLGLQIPRDISVAGFDNSPLRQMMKPELTTISLSTFEMGFFAARWLSDNIRHKETRRLRLEVDGDLVTGESGGEMLCRQQTINNRS